jgi:hypothetical protein
LSITPTVSSVAIISANADLWTANSGYNQDLGIWLSSTLNPPSIVAWKESGGSAGTFSPNAAAVQTILPVTAGVTYSVKLQWKANHSALGANIYAGAGPLANGQFSPTRLSVILIPTANLATAVSTQQYPLANSDGSTWQLMDGTNLITTLTPPGNGTALVSANADLWTANSGYNQDIGIFVSVNGGADQLVGWKESGGSAGTFSPNAAFLQTTWPVSAGSNYVFKIKWKANHSAAGATIYAGAGPIGGSYSPTRLNAIFEPTGSLWTVSTNNQYPLTGSDGATWPAMDLAGLLTMNFTPGTTGNYVVSANADLWTVTSGFNQDMGIFITGGSFTTATLIVWKESGGSAGAFSPNAAYAETVVSLQSGTQYTVWIAWKANHGGSSTIYAAAGPLPGGAYSPTRITAYPQQ